jgi:hypothetical protein
MKPPRRPILIPSMPGREAKRQIVLSAIHVRWGKFSDADLAHFKHRDDLVAQVALRYGQAPAAAGRDVDTLLDGRAV